MCFMAQHSEHTHNHTQRGMESLSRISWYVFHREIWRLIYIYSDYCNRLQTNAVWSFFLVKYVEGYELNENKAYDIQLTKIYIFI